MKLTEAKDIEKFIIEHRFLIVKSKFKFIKNDNSIAFKYAMVEIENKIPYLFFNYVIIDSSRKIADFHNTAMMYYVDRNTIIKDILN
jgi:hypothetical protein